MPRTIRIAAAQVGAVHRTDPRQNTLSRLEALLEKAALQGAQVVLFPECTFTTFFPRYLFADDEELESFFEHGDILTAKNTRPVFDKAKELGVDICIGFAEATVDGEHYNACVYYSAKSGSILSKYRKIHLPGDFEPFPEPDAVNQLEKRYFKPGNLGFKAFRVPGISDALSSQDTPIFGMMICNDRRWAEAWRCLGLQGVEVVLTGFNTAGFAPQMWGSSADMTPEDARTEAVFHHKLVMQAHSYTNSCFSVSAARCGLDDGKYDLIGGSTIVGPDGKIIAESKTEEDEVIIADCDLDRCLPGETRTFDFERHRRTEHYGILTSQTGVIEPVLPTISGDNHDTAYSTSDLNPDTQMRSVEKLESAKQIRILLCNPNATASMTNACLEMLKPTLPPDVTVYGFTAPKPAPLAIEGNFDNIMSAAAAARAIIPIADQYDAFLVACYSDHALTKMLREELSQPVVGIMEASLFAARTLGGRFGIIATSQRSQYTLADSVKNYGLDSFCAGVRSCNLGVLELESKPEKQVLDLMCGVAKQLVEEGADTLTLGCAGMTNMKVAVEQAVGEDVQVIDGVLAGVQHLSGLCRMGTRTAKRGIYASSSAGRQRRGQNWY
ncbi:carbon-nitrogen hydrolase [Stemphylium lycopersici]|uniref:Carbon-nitrogen hydrolase n=1 Tax=Stemphylium lycopersici TaxID=183478 RepID=A0A364MY42_STELY|nr:carbon-nitrogen hydrolase [Stemphylium lycopersici]RAR01147.1 carbon-nitrogen hydrolase [Stemphylium lycopersici]RAR06833.1 carbon-nitrogen hydrolase [Stemphylium lycopersici]